MAWQAAVAGWLGSWHGRAAAAAAQQRLAAAWQLGGRQFIGEIGFTAGVKSGGHPDAVDANSWHPGHALEVPTRAHGLLADAGGALLAVARRPGDWLLRWRPGHAAAQWHWIEDDRHLNGHVLAYPADARLWTTETDLETGAGLLGVRDALTLEKQAEWPTHGMDPHQLVVLPEAIGRYPAGSILVANGGIATRPETGRTRHRIDTMDSSLVVLAADDGRLLGQWRLADRHLGIRHLAWDPVHRCIGIALQAEHPDPAARQQAPVLAIWNGQSLRIASAQPPLAGYGGDIAAWPEGGFVVSAPRADTLARFDGSGQWRTSLPFRGAYALTATRSGCWVAGQPDVLDARQRRSIAAPAASAAEAPDARWQWDNHWIALALTVPQA